MATVAKRKRETSKFGQRLRTLREAAGLTQEALAERVDVPYQSIARYERGEVEPTWPRVVKFAEVLNVEPNDFLDDDEPDQPAAAKPAPKRPKK